MDDDDDGWDDDKAMADEDWGWEETVPGEEKEYDENDTVMQGPAPTEHKREATSLGRPTQVFLFEMENQLEAWIREMQKTKSSFQNVQWYRRPPLQKGGPCMFYGHFDHLHDDCHLHAPCLRVQPTTAQMWHVAYCGLGFYWSLFEQATVDIHRQVDAVLHGVHAHGERREPLLFPLEWTSFHHGKTPRPWLQHMTLFHGMLALSFDARSCIANNDGFLNNEQQSFFVVENKTCVRGHSVEDPPIPVQPGHVILLLLTHAPPASGTACMTWSNRAFRGLQHDNGLVVAVYVNTMAHLLTIHGTNLGYRPLVWLHAENLRALVEQRDDTEVVRAQMIAFCMATRVALANARRSPLFSAHPFAMIRAFLGAGSR
jgi:hypothetical protein